MEAGGLQDLSSWLLMMSKFAFRYKEILLDAGMAVSDEQEYSRLNPPVPHGGGHILRNILVTQNLAPVSE